MAVGPIGEHLTLGLGAWAIVYRFELVDRLVAFTIASEAPPA